MPEAWLPTHDTKIATALFTLGFPGRLRYVFDEKEGKPDFTWQMGTASLTVRGLDPRKLINSFEKGDLEQKEPEHLFLEGIGPLRNRERILGSTFMKGQRSICLGLCTGSKRTAYIHDATWTPPASMGRFRTKDFRLVCALGRVGIPLVATAGIDGHYEFTTTQHSLLQGTFYHAGAIAAELQADRLPAEHPVRWGVKNLQNFARLSRVIDQAKATVLVRKPNSQKAAWIHEDASNEAWDRVSRHFRI